MHFSKSLRTVTQLAIVTVCLSVPPTSLGVAADGYGDTPSPVPSLGIGNSDREGGPVASAEARHFREGTLVEGITGRFAMVGRRWAFIPDREVPVHEDAKLASPGESATTTENTTTTTVNSTVFDTKTSTGRSISIATTTSRNRNSLLKQYKPLDTPITANDLPQLLVIENITLQRVVEAVRAEQSDARWVISGEIKEFFEDNVLMLRTAKRSVAERQK